MEWLKFPTCFGDFGIRGDLNRVMQRRKPVADVSLVIAGAGFVIWRVGLNMIEGFGQGRVRRKAGQAENFGGREANLRRAEEMENTLTTKGLSKGYVVFYSTRTGSHDQRESHLSIPPSHIPPITSNSHQQATTADHTSLISLQLALRA